MTILIAIDDTDTKESRGTGRLARAIAGDLARLGTVNGVTRHQLLVHPKIPYTSHNSCAVIHLEPVDGVCIPDIVDRVRGMMLDDFIPGSDPGLAVAQSGMIGPAVMAFGRMAQVRVLERTDAVSLAGSEGIPLVGLGGTNGGMIGALAGLGLAASENDGRYIMKGSLRQFMHEASIGDLLVAGIDEVYTTDGERVRSGNVRLKKFPRPSLRNHRAILYVMRGDGCFDEVVRD